MKISLLHFCFEDYTIELANALANYVDLTLIQPYKAAADYKDVLDPRIQVCSFKKPRIRDPRNISSMLEMMRILRSARPDVLHVQETNDFWYDLTLLFNKMPPLVTTIHDVFRHPGDRHSIFGSEYTKRLAFYRSQQLIVHTQVLRQILVEKFKVAPQNVSVLPHGELGNLYLRQTDGKPSVREPYTLLFFGRIWPYKGLQYLVDAIPIIAKHIPEVKLIIAGRGENPRKYLPHYYDENRYEIIDGFIEPGEAVKLFQRSAVTVLPYVESSQSGVAALSYGLGTPVIASDVGGLREVVHHEQDGLLVPPRDVQALAQTITKFLSNQYLQDQMQTAISSRCQNDLNWLKIASQTVEIYKKVNSGCRNVSS